MKITPVVLLVLSAIASVGATSNKEDTSPFTITRKKINLTKSRHDATLRKTISNGIKVDFAKDPVTKVKNGRAPGYYYNMHRDKVRVQYQIEEPGTFEVYLAAEGAEKFGYLTVENAKPYHDIGNYELGYSANSHRSGELLVPFHKHGTKGFTDLDLKYRAFLIKYVNKSGQEKMEIKAKSDLFRLKVNNGGKCSWGRTNQNMCRSRSCTASGSEGRCDHKLQGKFIGCFKDSSNRDLPHRINGNLGAYDCSKRCQAAGYIYFGKQWTNECWCGNDYGKHSGQVFDCGNCMANKPKTPGWRNCVYETGERKDPW